MIDIRQSFEIEMKGAIPGTVHIPIFEVKRMLGHTLTEDEQDILDAGQPKDIDAQGFFTMINRLHHGHDHLLLCICNSGRRSLTAASLLRSLGYPKALSVAGGFGVEEAGARRHAGRPPRAHLMPAAAGRGFSTSDHPGAAQFGDSPGVQAQLGQDRVGVFAQCRHGVQARVSAWPSSHHRGPAAAAPASRRPACPPRASGRAPPAAGAPRPRACR